MSTPTLQSLFTYKAWANDELLAALGKLPPEHSEQLHVAIRTFNHMRVVDRLFRARLAGEPEPFQATNTKETPSLEELRSDVKSTDAWYVDYVSSIADSKLAEVLDFTFVDGDKGRMSRQEVLLHVILHGTYHRGNVGQVLKSIKLAPPRDLFTKFLHESEPVRREA